MHYIDAPKDFRKILSPVKRPTPQAIRVAEEEIAQPSEREQGECAFMVWRVGGEMPTVVHPTRGHAKMEAMRLALAHPDSRFHLVFGVADR